MDTSCCALGNVPYSRSLAQSFIVAHPLSRSHDDTESKEVLSCTNLGTPVITLGDEKPVSGALNDMVDRFLGEEKELRFITPEPVSFFRKIFG